MMKSTHWLAVIAIVLGPGAHANAEGSGPLVQASQPFGIAEAIKRGTFDLSFRYRYEHVDQASFMRDANASTLQTLLGYRTASFFDVSGYLQMRNVVVVGDDDFNDTINGKTALPVVADPPSTEVAQAYLQFENLPDTKITIGRRKFNWGNQRFVSSLGWRQNERSFDGIVVENATLPDTELKYSFLDNVNRTFTNSSPVGNFDGSSIHLFNAENSSLKFGTLTAYSYLLDLHGFATASRLSTQTYGANFTGGVPLGQSVKLLYELEYAKQYDYRDNPRDFGTDYYRLEGGLAHKPLTLKAGYEVLGSDGAAVGFSTPLALLHAYNGWADKFLATPPTGLEDLYFNATLQFKDVAWWLQSLKFIAVYHDFDSQDGGLDYGSEWDAAIVKTFDDHYALLFKYANYNAEDFSDDTEKYWVQFKAKY
jgi:hypothetical protein